MKQVRLIWYKISDPKVKGNGQWFDISKLSIVNAWASYGNSNWSWIKHEVDFK